MEVYRRDGGKCQDCSKSLLPMLGEYSLPRFEIDHIQSRGLGGGKRNDALVNLRLLCISCHREKHRPKAYRRAE